MTDANETTAVPGDGVVTIEIPADDGDTMVDLPPNLTAHLQVETIGNIQANNRDGRNGSSMAMGVLQMAAARNFDELGAVESRATGSIFGKPVASPAVQTGS